MEDKKAGGIGETLKTLLFAILIALGVRSFAYEPFNIPSGSMIPTLLVGDYLFVSKFAYGYSRYSVPLGDRLLGADFFDGRLFGTPPERGDVVVFKLPTDPSIDYIKRVIGLPGDTIQMRDGRLYINGDMVEREQIEDFRTEDRFGRTVSVTRYIETLPNGVQHPILENSDEGFLDDTPVFTVPEDHYFMMGDNRDSSQDSRVQSVVGYVPFENLVGRAEILWFSLDDAGFFEIWKWPTALRFDRMFTSIE